MKYVSTVRNSNQQSYGHLEISDLHGYVFWKYTPLPKNRMRLEFFVADDEIKFVRAIYDADMDFRGLQYIKATMLHMYNKLPAGTRKDIFE